MVKIALITPVKKIDYLTETLIDGLVSLKKEGQVEFLSSSAKYPSRIHNFKDSLLDRKSFLDFARTADFIFLSWGKDDTDFALANKINLWGKTIFIDGSELGKNRRYDKDVLKSVSEGEWLDNGKINEEMLKRCLLYFRREKPYVEGVIPLPYGIESRYHKNYSLEANKDVDFVCIFGQEDFPPLRRDVREYLEEYCLRNGFKCITKKTKTQDEFYELLARAKVGVSVGGGGYDTARFWEILGNNCLLMTEAIDIFTNPEQALPYKRIIEFSDLEGFKTKLAEVGDMLRTSYAESELGGEYETILRDHSAVARVKTIISSAESRLAEISNSCSVVVSSCDGFEDAWQPFFRLFFKYWPDCPFPVYLITNGKRYDDERVRTIAISPDRKWSSNLKETLRQIDTQYVIYFQEDYFLNKKIDTATIISLVSYAQKTNLACLRLFPSPGPNTSYSEFPNLGKISDDAPYRISTQTALWNKEYLDGILVDGETGWDFELKTHSDQNRRLFLSVKKPVIQYVKSTGIKKGRWTFDAIQLFKKEGIDISTSQRLSERRFEYTKRRIRSVPILGKFIKYLWK